MAAASGGKTFGANAFVAGAVFRFGFGVGLAFCGLGFCLVAGFAALVLCLVAAFAALSRWGFAAFFVAGLAFGLLAGFAAFFVVAAFANLALATGLGALAFPARFTDFDSAFDLATGFLARTGLARAGAFLVLLFAMILVSSPFKRARTAPSSNAVLDNPVASTRQPADTSGNWGLEERAP